MFFWKNFERNARRMDAILRGQESEDRAKARASGLPEYRQKPSGAVGIGKDSACWDCGAKGKNVDG